jgi:hypothetical protein
VRRSLVLLPLAGLFLFGCGDDGGDDAGDDAQNAETEETTGADEGADAEDTCAQIEAVAEIDPAAQPTQEDVDLVRSAAEGAPDEVADALNVVADIGQAIADLGPEELEDPSAFPDLEAIASAEEQAEAGEALVAFADEECGLEVPLFADFAA